MMNSRLCRVLTLCIAAAAWPLAAGEPLSGTRDLELDRPLDVVMVEGIDRFALREIERARSQRERRWQFDRTDADSARRRISEARARFAELIGATDGREDADGLELIASTERDALVAENPHVTVQTVRWPALNGVTAEGLFLRPTSEPVARVVAIPDADWSPEMISRLAPSPTSYALDLANMGCEVLVPTLINRDDEFSANPEIGRATNQTHREFVYRQAYELGRHIIGYEVQKVLAAVDQLSMRSDRDKNRLPLAVVGVGEGGLLALYSAAIDPRIDGAVVSGYFDQRERVWKEPIYRNVWRLLEEFGDAEVAAMIAPRRLWIETSPLVPESAGPPSERAGRRGAAPGVIARPETPSVLVEMDRAAKHWARAEASGRLKRIGTDSEPPLRTRVIQRIVSDLAGREIQPRRAKLNVVETDSVSVDDRQRRQLSELVRFTQRRLALSHRDRDRLFERADRSSLAAWERTSIPLREHVYAELIGKLPHETVDPDPRTRKVLDEEDYVGYEVVLDVFDDVIAGGVLLLPKNLRENERRPVVVCQHGLEGTPMDTIGGPNTKGYRAYKSFSAELARRGFIVYAPQNPYRGRDAFRTLQRKSNPLGRSLFSYIIPQHQVTLRWLASLPQVDAQRIAFYGLSYGGKTAMRVPPMLPPGRNDPESGVAEPGYCLSICSADFNEWVAKNASFDARFSYLWTGEYEIFEWNMGHVANYAELAMLMTPRPFMVERGHDDGVGIDEWVAWEFAKVRRHYNRLGIGDRTEIEFFDGPHTINGKGTFDFLHRHLNWPSPSE